MEATLVSTIQRTVPPHAFSGSYYMSADGVLKEWEYVEDLETHDVIVWDYVLGRETVRLKGHTTRLDDAAHIHNHNVLATLSAAEAQTRVWDVSTGKCTFVVHHTPHAEYVYLTPDAKFLLTVSHTHGNVDMWCAQTGKFVDALLHGTTMRLTLAMLKFSACGKYIAAGGVQHVRVWSVAQLVKPHDFSVRLPVYIDNFEFSEGGRMLAMSCYAPPFTEQKAQRSVFVLDTVSGDVVREFCLPSVGLPRARSMLACNQGLVVVVHDHEVTVLSLATGARLAIFMAPPETRMPTIYFDAKREFLVLCDAGSSILTYGLRFAQRDEILAILAGANHLACGSSSSTALSKFLRRDGDGRIVRNSFEWLRRF